MSYKLIGNLTSPYVRKIRLACHGRVTLDFDAVNYFLPEGEAYLRSISPINKLPILLDGDQKIFESRVIYNYLSQKHGWEALSLDDENTISVIDAGMETCVNMFLFRKGGMDLESDNWYLKRQKARLPNILEFLRPVMKRLDPQKPDDWAFPSMCLYSFLYWAQLREMIDLDAFPEAIAFLEAFKDKPGVAETTIPLV